MNKFYDVVVLGRSIGALATAALLARRDFTVLVVGQDQRSCAYSYEQRQLRRRSFTMLAATSPAWGRIITELAQSQTWKRRTRQCAPMLQLLAPRRRFEIPPDMNLFSRELEREFPEVRRPAFELYADLARVNAAADEAFARDAVWPPGTFWERRETGRLAALLPYVRTEPDADLLVEMSRAHLFRHVVLASVLFATHLSATPPPFAFARLHGAWTRGLLRLAGGEHELEQFLIERIEADGGKCLLSERASSLSVRGGAANGVLIDGDEHITGAAFVVTDGEGEQLAGLSRGEGISKGALREWPRITSSMGRFVVSIVARKDGLPKSLGHESFLLPGDRSTAPRGSVPPNRPVVHLSRCDSLARSGESLLIAEIRLPDRGPPSLLDARQAVLDTVIAELPFLDRHLLVVDSVHDGLPVWVYENGVRRSVERSRLLSATVAPEPMVRQIEVDPPGFLGIGGEPIRGPIERTLLVGKSVLPGLGQEGELLAALGAARLITKSDRQKERMRREMWNKVELG